MDLEDLHTLGLRAAAECYTRAGDLCRRAESEASRESAKEALRKALERLLKAARDFVECEQAEAKD